MPRQANHLRHREIQAAIHDGFTWSQTATTFHTSPDAIDRALNCECKNWELTDPRFTTTTKVDTATKNKVVFTPANKIVNKQQITIAFTLGEYAKLPRWVKERVEKRLL